METKKHRIVISYSLKLFCDGLESLINGFHEFVVVDCIPYNEGLIGYLKHPQAFDVLIVESNHPTKGDLVYVNQIVETFPSLKILLISNKMRSRISSNLIEKGVNGYILKTCTKQDLFLALTKVLDGKNFYCPELTKAILHENHHSVHAPDINLSEREKEVLAMLISCKTNYQIATNLGLSENTIKTHRRNIQNKFGVNNLIGMVRYACRANLIDFGHDDFCADCPHCS